MIVIVIHYYIPVLVGDAGRAYARARARARVSHCRNSETAYE